MLNMTELTMSARKKTSEATSNLRVAVRIRPMNSTERSEKCVNIVKADNVRMTVDLKGKPFGPFFRVYGQDTTQGDIYSDLVSSQIKKVIAGFNCTVFAYGQTGTGKTFTMEGGRTEAKSSQDDPTTGIIPRAVEDIFEQLETSGCEEYSLRVSYVELYNEELFDLLSSSENEDRERLRIFDDPNKKGVIVSNVEEVPVRNRSDVFKLLKIGAEKRKTAATLMNMHSSRSHSLFMVNVVVRENTNAGEELVKQGKLNLVDLAGSENIGRSGAQGSRAKEAGSINQSLLTLGRVIRSLTTNSQHVPYRESKLTRLLQDSLGGSTITSLIATLSPSSSNFEESQSTLEYAMRAANIKNKPVCNTKVSKKTILKEYSDEIEKLRRDLRAAREKNGVIISQESHEEFQRNTEKVHELEQQLDAVVDRLRRFTEDLMHMDEQYKHLYERKGELEDRLRERLRDMAVKEKELADTNDLLDKHVEALALMHTSSLKTFDQLLKTNHAAEEMRTDLSAFWRKVDEMDAANVKNSATVDLFLKNMSSFITRTGEQCRSLKSSGTTVSQEIVDSVRPHCEDLRAIAEKVREDTSDIQAKTTVCFKAASEIEKDTSTKIEHLSAKARDRWETILKSCDDCYKEHSRRAEDWNNQLNGRLDEIKQQLDDFTKDIRPLLSEIRSTMFDSFEKQKGLSESNVSDVKTTCSELVESMRALLSQFEQLPTRVEDNHQKQLLIGQEAQESLLSTLNTAEAVIQSVEDGVEEQCDAEEVNSTSQSFLNELASKFSTEVESAGKNAVEDQSDLQDVIRTFMQQSEKNRSDTNNSIDAVFTDLVAQSEQCVEKSDLILKKSTETSQNLSTIITGFEEVTLRETESCADIVSKVNLQKVDPSGNVPPRTVAPFPQVSDLITPPEPNALLGLEEPSTDSEGEELAKKKRRVTTYVRRDSLLDTTNQFMSPSSILRKREQVIEEEDFENM